MSSPVPSNLELARLHFIVNGMRVRVRPEVDEAQAELLIRRGLVELDEDFDAFVSGAAQKCLKPTQFGFDLILGRVEP